ncbi:minor capsid protein [Clostridium sporogenes]
MTREEKFIQSLYDEANEQLKEVYKEQKENRDELLREIALIMLTYTVLDSLMSLKSRDKHKEYKRLSKLITSTTQIQKGTQTRLINNILNNTVRNTFDFYSYNARLKDVKKIIENNFKGKHFSKRVWDNEKKVAEHLHKQVKKFLDGKVNVNQIKKDIEKTYNSSAYEAKRLTETEVNRCEDEAFRKFCKEVGVKKVRRNEILDRRTCSECAALDAKIYNLDEAPGVVHPLCRGFNTIVDDDVKKSKVIEDGGNNYKKDVSKINNDGIISNNSWLNSNFSSEKKFNKHIEKHLSEYENITEEKYLDIARKLLAAPLSEDIEGFINEDDFIFKYRKSTNDFSIGRKDGYISTLFKPKDKYDYWLQQVKDYKRED